MSSQGANSGGPNIHPGHGMGPAGASLSDILTAVKNVATNIANLGQLFLQVNGATTDGARALTATTLIKQGVGRVARVNVTSAPGSTQGYLVDANNAQATGPVIFLIPGTVGSYVVNMPFSLGLLVEPGGLTVTVAYS